MNLLSRMNPAQHAASSKILPSLTERVGNVIAGIVLFPGRAMRGLGKGLTSNTFLGLAGAAALLAATVGQKTGANAGFIDQITAPLLTNASTSGDDLPFPVQAVDRLRHKADAQWRLSMHPDHIHANVPASSVPFNPNDPLNQVMRQLSGENNITMDEFRAKHPEYQK